MTLKEMLRGIPLSSVSGDLAREIREVAFDSRQVGPGYAFFALPGARTDGNRFAKEAALKGAAAVISELQPPPAPYSLGGATWVRVPDAHLALGVAAANRYGRPSRAMTVVGVTGTNGKTTTTYMLESIFARAGHVPGVIGTVNARLNFELLERTPNTTPLALDLERMLKRLRDGGATHVAMEVSSHALALKRVEEVEFDCAVFTNLHRDHLDFHETRARYLEAKARLFQLLCRTSSTKAQRVAVLNRDDPAYPALRRELIDAREVTFGMTPDAMLRAEGVRATARETAFEAVWEGRRLPVNLKLIGAHNALNALAALGAASALGVDLEKCAEGLQALGCVPGRLEPVDCGQDYLVLVDYAHTDSALEMVLKSLKGIPHRKILTVFGCGGDRDVTKRGPMGIAACEGSDLAVATSDNPRSEDPQAILDMVVEGIRTRGYENYRVVPDRREAIGTALRLAQAEDIVLIAGKGHEDYQILKDRTIPFDDRQVVREFLKGVSP